MDKFTGAWTPAMVTAGLIGFYREIAGVGLLTKCESGLEQFKLADCWKDVWSPLPRSGNIGTAPLQEQASVICF